MESPDLLQLASGDPAPAPPALKREQDSLDDFEHLERAPPAPAPADLLPGLAAPPAPLAPPSAAAAAQSFLDTEREELLVPAAAHLADKFTDSESEPEASDSPRRAAPQPPAPLAPTPAPAAAAPTPAPPAPAPVAAPAPRPTEQPPAPPPKLPTEPPKLPTEPARAPQAHVIEAEVIFCQMGLDAWFKPERLHPKVESLIYWRDPARSGIALGAGLALLLALACCSVVSVLAYASLILLTGTVAFRIYKNILQAVQKTSDGHPFKWLLESDISLPAERSQEIAAAATAHANAAAHELRRLFLVEDLIDSLKFGVVLWMFTYLGACFNGITLFILGYVALFTLPKAYEANKAQVDANLELARAKINEITAKVRAAVPLGKKSESEKDK